MSEKVESFISMLFVRLIKELAGFFDSKLAFGILVKMGKKMASIDQRMANADLQTSLSVVEDKAILDGNVRLIHLCPFAAIHDLYKEATGTSIPDEVKDVMKVANNSGTYAAVIPFCILHQAFREAIGKFFDKDIKQLGARNNEGDIAVAAKNIQIAGLSDDEVKSKLKSYDCVYWIS